MDPRTLLKLINKLEQELEDARNISVIQSTQFESIAIIGMACRFPGADSIASYWDNLCRGVDSITTIPEDRWNYNEHFHPNEILSGKTNSKWGGFIHSINQFDAHFFNIAPQEAKAIDPQHRQFMMTAYHALEDAGCTKLSLKSTNTGVISAIVSDDYGAALRGSTQTQCMDSYVITGNDPSFAAGRLAYWLGVHGPTLAVNTACSSSLVAVHLACQFLRNQEANLMIVGGVNLMLTPYWYIASSQLYALSNDGHCKTFDKNANGYVRGEGCGVVVLKRLSDAERGNNNIYGVIRGSAVNHGGAANGLTAPNPDAQADLFRVALQQAKILPEEVAYVETHGSGTVLGDEIEASAIRSVYGTRTQPLILGAVKTNIGHLEAASGLAGLIKATLAVNQGKIPGNLHLQQLNTSLDAHQKTFYFPKEVVTFPVVSNFRRVAAISSFGLSGINAHMIVENHFGAPEATGDTALPVNLDTLEKKAIPITIGLSAQSIDSLMMQAKQLIQYLQTQFDGDLIDLAYTLYVKRTAFTYRYAVLITNKDDLVKKLESLIEKIKTNPKSIAPIMQAPCVGFVFPGLGEHYEQMGLDLYQNELLFKNSIEECERWIQSKLNLSLIDYLQFNKLKIENKQIGLFDFASLVGRELYADRDLKNVLDQPIMNHLALFAIEYALVKLLSEWGIHPNAVLGYSLGEYIASCVAGILTVEDALSLIYYRATLINSLPYGHMLAVAASAEHVQNILIDGTYIAIISGAELCIVAGDERSILSFIEIIRQKKILFRTLLVTHPLHTPYMQSIATSLERFELNIPKQTCRIPVMSNLTGDWIKPDAMMASNYFSQHVWQPVLLWQGLEKMMSHCQIIMEVGPGTSLSSLIVSPKQTTTKTAIAIQMMRHQLENKSDQDLLYQSIARYWQLGGHVAWEKVFASYRPKMCHIPHYVFDQKHYWADWLIQSIPTTFTSNTKDVSNRSAINDWFYTPVWEQLPITIQNQDKNAQKTWVIFTDGSDLAQALISLIYQTYPLTHVAIVAAGTDFVEVNYNYWISISNTEHLQKLFKRLSDLNFTTDHIVYFAGFGINQINECHSYFMHLLHVAQSIEITQQSVDFDVITNNVFNIIASEGTSPWASLVLGITKVWPYEYSKVRCRVVDVDTSQASYIPSDLLKLFQAAYIPESILALRGKHFWRQKLYPLTLLDIDEKPVESVFRQQGCYVITGGLGKLGLVVAHYLIKNYSAKLILITRSANSNEKQKELEQFNILNADVTLIEADISDEESIQREFVNYFKTNHRAINGVFHCAGVPGVGLISCKTPKCASTVFKPKVDGLIVLQKIFRNKAIDFFINFSSCVSYMPFIGESDYCAANLFLDTYMNPSVFPSTSRYLSIAWGAWQEDAWQESLLNNFPELQRRLVEFRKNYGISAVEGMLAIELMLKQCITQVAVITMPPKQYHQHLCKLFEDAKKQTIRPTSHDVRPQFTTSYVAAKNKEEQKMVDIWQYCFGICQIGVQDNFFEMGGNSLIAMHILAGVEKEFSTSITVRQLFNAPTIEVLCKEHLLGQLSIKSSMLKKVCRKIEFFEKYPLTQGQHGLWFEQLRDPKSFLYNLPIFLEINGRLNFDALQYAADKIVERHPLLNVSFHLEKGLPFQVVNPGTAPSLILEDVGSWDVSVLQEVFNKESTQVFNLTQAPLWRFRILKQASDKHILIFTIHHILFDGLSYNIFMKELVYYYQTYNDKKKTDLPYLKRTYMDYVDWQRCYLHSETCQIHVDFWKLYLRDLKKIDCLFGVRKNIDHKPVNRHHKFLVHDPVLEGLKKLAQQLNTSLFLICLSAFSLLLLPHTNQQVVLATPVANRPQSDLYQVIGYFVNTLIVCIQHPRNTSLSTFIRQTHQNFLEVLSYSEMPFQKLMEMLPNVREHFNRTGISILFTLQNDLYKVFHLNELKINRIEPEFGVARNDLVIELDLSDGHLKGDIYYDGGLFELEKIKQISETYIKILHAFGNDLNVHKNVDSLFDALLCI